MSDFVSNWNNELLTRPFGPLGIIVAHAILGEVTPKMAEAVGGSRAKKILIPVNSCSVSVVGVEDMPLAGYVTAALRQAEQYLK